MGGHAVLSDLTVKSRSLFLKSLRSLFQLLSSQYAKSAKNATVENRIKLALQECVNLGHQDPLEETESQESLARLVREDIRELRECSVNQERMACREKRETKDHLE